MSSIEKYQHFKSQICQTPFEPKGLVLVRDFFIDKVSGDVMASVWFWGDHPHGYKHMEDGLYFAKDLQLPPPIDPETEAQFIGDLRQKGVRHLVTQMVLEVIKSGYQLRKL